MKYDDLRITTLNCNNTFKSILRGGNEDKVYYKHI
jgi:hypothetical protein